MHLARSIPWRILRKACSAVTAAAYLCATIGLPMPLAAGEPGQAAFPCQMLLCGCMTAEQCQSCGCFTPQQQVAWAAAHHTQPPANAEKEQTTPPPCCCDGSHETSSCQHCAKKARSCCTPRPKPACCQSSTDSDAKHKTPVRWGGMSAGRCQGMAMSWVTTGAAAPPSSPVVWQPCLAFAGWLAANQHPSAQLTFDLVDPPPRS